MISAARTSPPSPSRRSTKRGWQDFMLPAVALAPMALGVVHFFWIGKFVPGDALWFLIDIPIAAAVLAFCDFIHFRSRLPVWIFVFPLAAVAVVIPHFSIGLGIVLGGLAIFNSMQ